MGRADFWNNQQQAQATVDERKSLSTIVDPLATASRAHEDLAAMIEMAEEDEAFAEEVPAEIARLEGLIEGQRPARRRWGDSLHQRP